MLFQLVKNSCLNKELNNIAEMLRVRQFPACINDAVTVIGLLFCCLLTFTH